MSRKIFIIHPSLIIRKGLFSVLQRFFSCEIIQLESTAGLASYLEKEHGALFFFIDAEYVSDLSSLYQYTSSSPVRIVAVPSCKECQREPLPADHTISIYESADEIQSLVADFFKSEKVKPSEQEGQELSTREKEVLKLVALGHSNKLIAEELFISAHTVISHRKNITEKLGIKSISGLTIYAILNKLIDSENLDPQSLI